MAIGVWAGFVCGQPQSQPRKKGENICMTWKCKAVRIWADFICGQPSSEFGRKKTDLDVMVSSTVYIGVELHVQAAMFRGGAQECQIHFANVHFSGVSQMNEQGVSINLMSRFSEVVLLFEFLFPNSSVSFVFYTVISILQLLDSSFSYLLLHSSVYQVPFPHNR